MKKYVLFAQVLIVTAMPNFALADAAADRLKGCTGDNCIDMPGQDASGKDGLHLPTLGLDTGINSIGNILITIAAIVATFFLVLGGIKYITSDGDPGKAQSAKQTVTYAIVGLAVAIMARAIIGFSVRSSPF